MKGQTAVEARKQSQRVTPLVRGIPERAAVRPLADHAAPLAARHGTRAPAPGRDFSRVPVCTAAPTMIQPKLAIGQPGDKYEQEADRVAEQVMRMPEPRAARQPRPTCDEEETLQAKPLAGQITPVVQCQVEPEEEEEEETIQPKLAAAQITPLLQRQVEPEEEEEEEPLQAKQAGGKKPPISPGLQAQIASLRGGGQPLPKSVRSFFEPRFGCDFSQVRMHTGPKAASTARAINARAFTKGPDIYFAEGRFQPDTPSGRELLAHELTHSVQQGKTSAATEMEGPSQPSLSTSRQNDPLEHNAEAVAKDVAAGHSLPVGAIPVGAAGGQAVIARQATAETAPPASGEDAAVPSTPGEAAAIAPTPPAEPISIAGSDTLTPSPAWAAYLESRGEEGAAVPVQLGNLARGRIPVRKRNGTFETIGRGHKPIPLYQPALQPVREAGIEPVLAVRIRESAIRGYVTIATDEGAAGNPRQLVNWIKDHATEMGWLGLDVSRIPDVTNELSGGVLRLQLSGFRFTLGGFVEGTGDFGLANETVTFSARATVRVENLTESQLELERDEQGNLRGQVEIPVAIANFSGNLLAEYGNGTVNIEGTVGYSAEKFSGEVTVLVTDRNTARNVARRRLSPEQIAASAEQAAGTGEAEAGPVRGPRAIAGYGTLDFAFTEWMTGRAEVIIDNEGHITVIGEIAPPAEVELFPQRDYIRELFSLEVRTLYGVPLVGNVFLFANIGMEALAKLGPGKIYNIAVRGTYSTDPDVLQNYELEATLNISAYAGLRLRGEGGVGVELLGHDIKAGVGLFALAGIRGYVEATPTIGYRETADPQEGRQGEYFIKGHMEIAAQPFLGLGGDLFVELDSPWWSPAPDKKWTWPLGQLEYPLPGEFGIGADVDYVVGSDELPEIQFGEVDFNKDKFMTDLLNDHVPPKSQGEQEKQGEWQEDETTGEAAEPTLVDSAAAPSEEPARGRQEPGEGEPPSPQIQQQWLQGVRALGQLVEESQTTPLDRRSLNTRLAQIRKQYGFTELRVEAVGEDWAVYPRMNPESTQPFTIEGQGPTEDAEDGSPQLDAPTGKTSGNPIEMIWYKPPGLYPPSIQLGEDRYFFNEPEPLVVPDVRDLPDVRRSGYTSGEISIGIDPAGEFYPRLNNVWPRVYAKPLRTGAKQANFRQLLREYGYDWGTKEADHVRDLQWGGEDDYDNLWPLERTWNQAANRILDQSVTYTNDTGQAETVPLRDTPLNRWFIIKGIHRP